MLSFFRSRELFWQLAIWKSQALQLSFEQHQNDFWLKTKAPHTYNAIFVIYLFIYMYSKHLPGSLTLNNSKGFHINEQLVKHIILRIEVAISKTRWQIIKSYVVFSKNTQSAAIHFSQKHNTQKQLLVCIIPMHFTYKAAPFNKAELFIINGNAIIMN